MPLTMDMLVGRGMAWPLAADKHEFPPTAQRSTEEEIRAMLTHWNLPEDVDFEQAVREFSELYGEHLEFVEAYDIQGIGHNGELVDFPVGIYRSGKSGTLYYWAPYYWRFETKPAERWDAKKNILSDLRSTIYHAGIDTKKAGFYPEP